MKEPNAPSLARDFGDRATGLGQFPTDAVRSVARENPGFSGVVDETDFNATAAG